MIYYGIHWYNLDGVNGMSLRVNDIFIQKLNEIQSRVPVRIKGTEDSVPFSQFLDNAGKVNTPAVDKEGKDRSKDISMARAMLSKSKAVIPKDKSVLMNIIENNIREASKKYGVDANLIRAVIRQESGYDPRSLSKAGAQGLMQLMPETADALNLSDPWDVTQNIDGGTRFLRDQLSAFDGNLKLALAAYNAGPEAVRRYNNTIPPYAETQDYVTRVLQYYRQYSRGNE